MSKHLRYPPLVACATIVGVPIMSLGCAAMLQQMDQERTTQEHESRWLLQDFRRDDGYEDISKAGSLGRAAAGKKA